MKGLNIKEWGELMLLVQGVHSFARWSPPAIITKLKERFPKINEKVLDHGYNIKYTEFGYDSRTQDIWWVKFRGFGELTFRTNAFVMQTDKQPFPTLKEWVTEYLLGNWEPSEQFIKEFMS